jgi:hypothetical protein
VTLRKEDRKAAALSAYKGVPAWVDDWVESGEVPAYMSHGELDTLRDLVCWAADLERHREQEVARIVAWLRGPHVGSDTEAWKSAIRPLYDELASDLERGAFR